MSNSSQKIIVGMSGGVDSSVSAYLLQSQGYLVEGVFMKNWNADDDDQYCTSKQDLADAQAVCDKLAIPLHTVNFAHQYWDKVFTHFLAEYRCGRTPNPDILCNSEIKFNAFLTYAKSLGADKIATGHYARLKYANQEYQLCKAKDRNKDQSYFLHRLNQSQLAFSLFPLAGMLKSQVREIANKLELSNAKKKDSTGICFIGERKFRDFLQEFVLSQPGDIKSPSGDIVGKHAGLMFYTLGQRQGLGIGGLSNYPDSPWYVLDKDLENNHLIVAQDGEHPLLMSQGLICTDWHWINNSPEFPLNCTAKTRYRQDDQACLVAQVQEKLIVQFCDKQRAITPGQSIVFYDGSQCLGGGVIDERIA